MLELCILDSQIGLAWKLHSCDLLKPQRFKGLCHMKEHYCVILAYHFVTSGLAETACAIEEG
jgi:hypothetical protein